MENEISSFINIWLTAAISLILSHQISRRIPSGAARLLSLLPVIYLFTTLPLRLSSIHLGVLTFFLLVGLANSKLLLFAFDQGPLSTATLSYSSPLPLISTTFLPIKPKQPSSPHHKPIIPFHLKCCIFVGIAALNIYKLKELMHPFLISVLYSILLYLLIDLVSTVTAALVRAVLGLELEPIFNEPYLSTSLQDFWGTRWNLVVTNILRSTVYYPLRRICISTTILSRGWAHSVSSFACFLVSGLIHELMYYYLTRVHPTWETTCFFLLHGFLVGVEVWLKKALGGRWGLPTAISRPLTVGFVVVSTHYLFFPQLIRNGVDLKIINEYSVLLRFIDDRLSGFLSYYP